MVEMAPSSSPVPFLLFFFVRVMAVELAQPVQSITQLAVPRVAVAMGLRVLGVH